MILRNGNQKNLLKDSNSELMTVDTAKYLEFVHGVTSPPSLDYPILSARLSELEANGTNVTQLLTAALGLTAEAGEFTEVVKKIFLQGKPYTEENVFHMKRELGDICWYLAQACMEGKTYYTSRLKWLKRKLQSELMLISSMSLFRR